MQYLFMLLGWLGLISGNIFWIGHAIWELIKTDQGFFTVAFTNGGLWLIHMFVSLVLLFIGAAGNFKKR